MRLRISEIAQTLGVQAPDADPEVSGISVDSRKSVPGDLFCAIVGERSDGHDFIDQAAVNGAVAALVTKPVEAGVPTLRVDLIDYALARLAAHIRDGFDGVVIGVTGSVGKTTVKDLLAAALSTGGSVLKSEGNLNTEYGLPMTWMKLEPSHKYVVLEMAMRGKNQIAHLCRFSRPHAGLITTIGTAHIGELGSRANIGDAKMELLDALPVDGLAVLPDDCDFLEEMRHRAACRALTFGFGKDADARITEWNMDVENNVTDTEFEVIGNAVRSRVPGLGKHQSRNAAAALAMCAGLDIPVEVAAKTLEQARLQPDRLRAVELEGVLVLVDIYNSSLESCIQGLRVLASLEIPGERVAIIGDMLEQGEHAEDNHRAVGAEVVRLNLDRVCTIGRVSHWIRDEALRLHFNGRLDALGSVEDVAKIINGLQPGDAVLVKGSRALELERALELAGVGGA